MAGNGVPRQVSRVIFPEDGVLRLDDYYTPGSRADIQSVFGRVPKRPYLVWFRRVAGGRFETSQGGAFCWKRSSDFQSTARICFLPDGWSSVRVERTHRVLTRAQARRLAARLNVD